LTESWRGSLLADRFRLEDRIGSGEMAQVFRAHDESWGMNVAIKILRPEYVEDPDFVAAFMREARLGATVKHKNVMSVYDVGALPDGTRFLVLELCEGPTLEELITNRGALPLDRFYDIALQLCAGLAAAHTKGVIHRDLKPENVKLAQGHTVKILDFGLAKLPTPNAVSRRGAFIGTPVYVSPEQAMSEPLDMRTDIYSLGITLYEMAAGSPPFVADNYQDILTQHLHDAPPAIVRDVPIPELLEALICKCLEKEPSDRPVNVRRVRADLDALRAGTLDAITSQILRESDPRFVAVSNEELETYKRDHE
jgi:serine/threonine protein kinase